MKKALILGGIILFTSCGGGGGGGDTSSVPTITETYKLAEVSQPEEVGTTPVVTTRAVDSLVGVSEEVDIKGENSSKGVVLQILEKVIGLQPTRSEEFTIFCDNNGRLKVYIDYELVYGVSQPQSCGDFKELVVIVNNYIGEDCQLEDYLIDGSRPFTMKMTFSELVDPDCYPESMNATVDGVVKHIENRVVDESFIFNNLNIYMHATWVGEEISSGSYTIKGEVTYILGDFPLAVDAQIDYWFDITGSGNEDSETFSGYVKLGCLDGWLKVQTTKPLRYLGDEVVAGEVTIQAKNGKIIISYSPEKVSITQMIDNQVETYTYSNTEEIKEDLKGVVCVEQ